MQEALQHLCCHQDIEGVLCLFLPRCLPFFLWTPQLLTPRYPQLHLPSVAMAWPGVALAGYGLTRFGRGLQPKMERWASQHEIAMKYHTATISIIMQVIKHSRNKNEYVRPAICPQNNFAYVQYVEISLYDNLLSHIRKSPHIQHMWMVLQTGFVTYLFIQWHVQVPYKSLYIRVYHHLQQAINIPWPNQERSLGFSR